jgi:hypothetical protein
MHLLRITCSSWRLARCSPDAYNTEFGCYSKVWLDNATSVDMQVLCDK